MIWWFALITCFIGLSTPHPSAAQGYKMAVWTKAHLRKQVPGEHLKHRRGRLLERLLPASH